MHAAGAGPGLRHLLEPTAMLRPILWLLPLLALAGCGDLPQPFLGNPGATGRILARPPTPRLAVPPPANALLPDEGNRMLAADLAKALQAQEVPAVPGTAERTEWRLETTAAQRGETVVPTFTVRDPQGKDRGNAEGAPVPTASWAAASPATLQQSAAEAAPKIAALLTNIETTREMADPNSLYNRRAKVMVADVTGAPGDGDAALTKQMRMRLGLLGPAVQDAAAGADFTVRGQVRVVPIPGHKQRVEIQWLIKNAEDQDLGRVVQLNEIPAGTLDHYWGDVAVVVATEASSGVEDVIKKQTTPPAEASAQKAALRGQAAEPLLETRGSGVERPAR
jgi:hypothetical protein